jgi:hypothetical protein
VPIAGPLTQAQEREWRIDILRPVWLAQVEQTKVALQVIAASQPVGARA